MSVDEDQNPLGQDLEDSTPDPPEPVSHAQDAPNPAPSVPDAPVPAAEKYPSTFIQDQVGRVEEPSKCSPAIEGEHLLGSDKNVLANNAWVKDPPEDCADVEDQQHDSFAPPSNEWDELFTGDYFTVMGFLFKMNTLRVNQKQLPIAIALLLVIYMFIACYVLYVMLGAMMAHLALKYQNEPCDQNLCQWALVTGVYIITAFVLNLVSLGIKLAWKKEPLAALQHIGTLFALIWFIIGCVRVYKIDSGHHQCPALLYKVSYYYCTVTLGLLGGLVGLICCGTAVFAARQTQHDDGV